jgi:hypothetical protein
MLTDLSVFWWIFVSKDLGYKYTKSSQPYYVENNDYSPSPFFYVEICGISINEMILYWGKKAVCNQRYLRIRIVCPSDHV